MCTKNAHLVELFFLLNFLSVYTLLHLKGAIKNMLHISVIRFNNLRTLYLFALFRRGMMCVRVLCIYFKYGCVKDSYMLQ